MPIQKRTQGYVVPARSFNHGKKRRSNVSVGSAEAFDTGDTSQCNIFEDTRI